MLKNNYINVFYHFFSNNLLKKNGFNNAKICLKYMNKFKKNKREIKINLFGDTLIKYLIK